MGGRLHLITYTHRQGQGETPGIGDRPIAGPSQLTSQTHTTDNIHTTSNPPDREISLEKSLAGWIVGSDANRYTSAVVK